MMTIYKNLCGDLVVAVPKERKPNVWTYRLKLHYGNRNHYNVFDSQNQQIGGNELDFRFENVDGVWSVIIEDIQASGSGNGTILMKSMLEHIKNFEEENNTSIEYIRGWLSSADSKNNWKISIPFYLNLPKMLEENSPWKDHIIAEIYLLDKHQPRGVGKKIDDIEQFVRDGKDGYIIYSLQH